MDLQRIQKFLEHANKPTTQKALLLPKFDNDCDIVFEIDYIVPSMFSRTFIRKQHELFDSHEGWCLVICYKTKKRFFHLIQCPNKYSLLCRGCGEEI